MGESRWKEWSGSDNLAVALACLAAIMAIVLFWIDRTPLACEISILAMASLMVFPVLHFIASRRNRIYAAIFVALSIGAFAWKVWPRAAAKTVAISSGQQTQTEVAALQTDAANPTTVRVPPLTPRVKRRQTPNPIKSLYIAEEDKMGPLIDKCSREFHYDIYVCINKLRSDGVPPEVERQFANYLRRYPEDQDNSPLIGVTHGSVTVSGGSLVCGNEKGEQISVTDGNAGVVNGSVVSKKCPDGFHPIPQTAIPPESVTARPGGVTLSHGIICGSSGQAIYSNTGRPLTLDGTQVLKDCPANDPNTPQPPPGMPR